MKDFFHISIIDDFKIKLKKQKRGLEKALAQSFKTKLGMPSTPEVKEFFDALNTLNTSSSENLET